MQPCWCAYSGAGCEVSKECWTALFALKVKFRHALCRFCNTPLQLRKGHILKIPSTQHVVNGWSAHLSPCQYNKLVHKARPTSDPSCVKYSTQNTCMLCN